MTPRSCYSIVCKTWCYLSANDKGDAENMELIRKAMEENRANMEASLARLEKVEAEKCENQILYFSFNLEYKVTIFRLFYPQSLLYYIQI